MAVPTHMRLVVRGHFDSTPETWSFGTKYSRDNPGGIDASYGEVQQGEISNAVTALFNTSMFSVGVVVDDWRMYVIGTDGKMQGNGPSMVTFTPNSVKGTSGSAVKPPQCAVAVTTVADNRGPAKLGRFYLPVTQHPLEADWRLSVANATEIAEASTQFMKAVSDGIDLEVTQSAVGLNISATSVSNPAGVRQEIDHLEVGRVYDTLRNRRKSMLEDRIVHGPIDW